MKFLKGVSKETRLLICIIAVQVIYLTCMFAVNKQGFHSDELWTYGIGNASESDYRHEENVLIPTKTNQWMDSKYLNDYITVSEEERFDYASAYINSSNDYNPPLSYMMIHFVCSLFTDKWSKWYGFALNMIYLVITQIFVYKFSYSIMKKHSFALIAVAFFGFTMGAQEIFTYIRFYAPGTMLTVIAFYYASELYNCRDDKEQHRKLLVKLFIINLLGFLTLHLAVVAAFAITALYCIYYMFSKRFSLMFKYGFTMLATFIASVVLYPRTLYNLFSPVQEYDYTQHMYPVDFQLKHYWAFITNDLFGVHTSVWKTMTTTYICLGVIIFIFFAIPIVFIFRNDEWMKKIIINVKSGVKTLIFKLRHMQFTYIVLIMTVAFILFMASRRTSVYGMGVFADRYVFIAYPLLAIFTVCIICSVMTWIMNIKFANMICAVILAVFCVMSNILSYNPYYLKHEETGVSLDEIESDANSIVLLSDEWLLICMTNEIGHTGQYYATTYGKAKNVDYELEKLDKSKPLYLIMDKSGMEKTEMLEKSFSNAVFEDKDKFNAYTKQEYIDYYKKLDGVEKCELVGTDAIFGRLVEIYRLN